MIPLSKVLNYKSVRNVGHYASGAAHVAFDIEAEPGTPIYSPGTGQVLIVGNNKLGGHEVMILYPNSNVKLLFSHLRDAPKLSLAQKVDEGQLIGYVGNSGHVVPKNFYHLHLQTWIKGVRVLPSKLFTY